MKKGIKNADTIACKLKPVSTRTTNNSFEVATKKMHKKEDVKKRRKTEAMATKRQRIRGGISLSSEEKDKSDIRNNKD